MARKKKERREKISSPRFVVLRGAYNHKNLLFTSSKKCLNFFMFAPLVRPPFFFRFYQTPLAL